MNQAEGWDEHGLERRALAGGAFYVEPIERDLEHGRLILHLSLVPEPNVTVVRILTFAGVENFQEYWDEEEDTDYTEQIFGLHQRPHGTGFDYVTRLDQFEIHFHSAIEPTLEEV